MKKITSISFIFLLIFLLSSCTEDAETIDYSLTLDAEISDFSDIAEMYNTMVNGLEFNEETVRYNFINLVIDVEGDKMYVKSASVTMRTEVSGSNSYYDRVTCIRDNEILNCTYNKNANTTDDSKQHITYLDYQNALNKLDLDAVIQENINVFETNIFDDNYTIELYINGYNGVSFDMTGRHPTGWAVFDDEFIIEGEYIANGLHLACKFENNTSRLSVMIPLD